MMAVSVIESVLNEALKLDPESLDKIAALEGKVIALEISGLGVTLYLMPTADGVQLHSVLEGDADVLIKGGPLGLARMGLSRHPASLFGEGVEIEGDVDLGRKVQKIIDDLDIDWEEPLSHLLGDVAAHQLGNLFRGAAQWAKKSGETFSEDLVEYLQEESRDLVVRSELDQFLDNVDTLRVDVERLEQRVRRLQQAGAQTSDNA